MLRNVFPDGWGLMRRLIVLIWLTGNMNTLVIVVIPSYNHEK